MSVWVWIVRERNKKRGMYYRVRWELRRNNRVRRGSIPSPSLVLANHFKELKRKELAWANPDLSAYARHEVRP